MFETLMSKTFLILALSLGTAYIGSLLSVKNMELALRIGDVAKVKKTMWTAIIANIIAFVLLLIFRANTPINMFFMFLFTLSSGFTLGIYTISYGDVASKAVALTALITVLTGLIATYSGLDFSWMGKFLFFALIGLIIVSVIGIFVKMRNGTQRMISIFGVIIFTGYLLYDFNRLAKLKAVVAANNWETALNFAISIYLDIVNLLMYLMQLLGGSSSK